MDEAGQYFAGNTVRQAKGTTYKKTYERYLTYNGISQWWLRSPGYYQNYAAYAYSRGGVREDGRYVCYRYDAVRPALWIDLNS